ncbi:MAG: tripartite tricarboxylate transporter substrate binding protein [Pseudomonadota bacterium]
MFSAFSASAQQYPTKPIRVLIPSPPGGATDILGRLLKRGFDAQWNQPVIIDNRGGASGRIAAAHVAKAAPDGYTLLFTYGGVLTTGLPLFKNLPYDPIADFEAVAMMAHVPSVLVAHPSFPAKTVAEIIKMAKANPGGLTHGASSIGSASHLNMELLKQMAGIDMLAVAYNGDGPALIGLLGGQVPFGFNNLVAASAHIQAGKLRPIAVATSERVPNLPDVPTVAESGIPGYESLLFYALVAPAKTPRSIVRQLNEAVTKMKQNPDIKQNFVRLGAIPIDMTPEELSAFLKRDLEKWTKVIQTANIRPE